MHNREHLINVLKCHGVRMDFEYISTELLNNIAESVVSMENNNVKSEKKFTNIVQIHDLILGTLPQKATLSNILKVCAGIKGEKLFILSGKIMDDPSAVDYIAARSFIKFLEYLGKMGTIIHIGELQLPEMLTIAKGKIYELSSDFSIGKIAKHQSIGFNSDDNFNLSAALPVFEGYRIYSYGIEGEFMEYSIECSEKLFDLSEQYNLNAIKNEIERGKVLRLSTKTSDNLANLYHNVKSVSSFSIHSDIPIDEYDYIKGNEYSDPIKTILGRINLKGEEESETRLHLRPNVELIVNSIYEKVCTIPNSEEDLFVNSVELIGKLNILLKRNIQGVICHKYDPILHKYYKRVRVLSP